VSGVQQPHACPRPRAFRLHFEDNLPQLRL
jgi:hypothetical protein